MKLRKSSTASEELVLEVVESDADGAYRAVYTLSSLCPPLLSKEEQKRYRDAEEGHHSRKG